MLSRFCQLSILSLLIFLLEPHSASLFILLTVRFIFISLATFHLSVEYAPWPKPTIYWLCFANCVHSPSIHFEWCQLSILRKMVELYHFINIWLILLLCCSNLFGGLRVILQQRRLILLLLMFFIKFIYFCEAFLFTFPFIFTYTFVFLFTSPFQFKVTFASTFLSQSISIFQFVYSSSPDYAWSIAPLHQR